MPKIIHFIWVGPKPCPKLKLIEQWKRINPDCQIILWTDRRASPSGVFKTYRERGYRPVKTMKGLIAKHPPSQESDESNKPILFADLSRLFKHAKEMLGPEFTNQIERIVRYEIERFHPNFGAASDILRYLILHTYGGAYFDCDVLPRDKKISSECISFQEDVEEFKITRFSQGERVIGSDALVCTAGHRFILKTLNNTIRNYTEIVYNNPTHYDEPEYVFSNTIRKTGPSLIRSALASIEEYIEKPSGYYGLSPNIYNPKSPNDASWAEGYMYSISSINEGMFMAQNSLETECDVINILRFGAHAQDIVLALKKPLLDAIKFYTQEKIIDCLPLESTNPKKDFLLALVKIFPDENLHLDEIDEFFSPLATTSHLSEQTRDFIKLINKTFTEKVLKSSTRLELAEKLTSAIARTDPFKNKRHKLIKAFFSPEELSQFLTKFPNLYRAAQRLIGECSAIHCPIAPISDIKTLSLDNCYNICKTLMTASPQIKLIETTVGNHLALRLIDKASIIDDILEEEKCSELDEEFGDCLIILSELEENPKLEEIKQIIGQLNRRLTESDRLFSKSRKNRFATKGLFEFKTSAYQTENLIIDTVHWWCESSQEPNDLIELTCRMHDIQASLIDTEIAYQKSRLAMGDNDRNIPGILFALRGSAKEQRMAAAIKRFELNDSPSYTL